MFCHSALICVSLNSETFWSSCNSLGRAEIAFPISIMRVTDMSEYRDYRSHDTLSKIVI